MPENVIFMTWQSESRSNFLSDLPKLILHFIIVVDESDTKVNVCQDEMKLWGLEIIQNDGG